MDAARGPTGRLGKDVRGRLRWGEGLGVVVAILAAVALGGVAGPNLINRHSDLAMAGAAIAYLLALGLVILAVRRLVRRGRL